MKLVTDIEQPCWDLNTEGVIYALYLKSDPRLRYGGQTIRSANARYQGHLSNARRLAKKGRGRGLALPVNYWIVKHGLDEVRMVILEVVGTNQEALNSAEEEWITWLGTFEDPEGLNLRPGGASSSGWVMSDEQKERISKANTGRKHVLSDEMVAKKRKWMLEVQEAHGNPNKRLTEEIVLDIKSRLFTGEAVPEIAERFKVTPANVYAIRRNLTWVNVPWQIGPIPHDRHKNSRVGDLANNRTLTSQDAAEIKARLWAGEYPDDIAEDFSVSSGAIREIEKGNTWASVPDPEGARVERRPYERAREKIRGQKRDADWFEIHGRTYRQVQLDKAKFSIRDIRRVRSLRFEMGESYKGITLEMGGKMTFQTVGKICRGERWQWVL